MIIRADEVKPCMFIRINGEPFTVRYCYYDNEREEVTIDFEKGKTSLHPLIDKTALTLTYQFSAMLEKISDESSE